MVESTLAPVRRQAITCTNDLPGRLELRASERQNRLVNCNHWRHYRLGATHAQPMRMTSFGTRVTWHHVVHAWCSLLGIMIHNKNNQIGALYLTANLHTFGNVRTNISDIIFGPFQMFFGQQNNVASVCISSDMFLISIMKYIFKRFSYMQGTMSASCTCGVYWRMLAWTKWPPFLLTTFKMHFFNSSPPWTKWPPFWQTTFSNAFSWMKRIKIGFKFHWNLFPGVQLTINQHWFR